MDLLLHVEDVSGEGKCFPKCHGEGKEKKGETINTIHPPKQNAYHDDKRNAFIFSAVLRSVVFRYVAPWLAVCQQGLGRLLLEVEAEGRIGLCCNLLPRAMLSFPPQYCMTDIHSHGRK